MSGDAQITTIGELRVKIYLASKFANAALMREHRTDLERLGHTVTSRWIDSSGVDSHYTAADWEADAVQCIKDVRDCDVLVHCIPDDHGGRGGRHVEFGMALMLGKGLVIVGERELVFHWLPLVKVFPTWEDYLGSISIGRMTTLSDQQYDPREIAKFFPGESYRAVEALCLLLAERSEAFDAETEQTREVVPDAEWETTGE